MLVRRINVAFDNHNIIRNNIDKIPQTLKYNVTSLLNTNIKNAPNNISIMENTTNKAIQYFTKRNFKVSALNFANSLNPGGGYLYGCVSQEEELCRCSPYLYASLNDKRKVYYPFEWTDTILYTSDVKFIRHDYDKTKTKQYALLDTDNYYYCDIITSAFPDLRNENLKGKFTSEENLVQYFSLTYREKMENLIRAIYILSVGRTNILILGAFGCGAFSPTTDFNNVYPEFVASCFYNVLKNIGGDYEHICFAIPDEKSINYKAFLKIFTKNKASKL